MWARCCRKTVSHAVGGQRGRKAEKHMVPLDPRTAGRESAAQTVFAERGCPCSALSSCCAHEPPAVPPRKTTPASWNFLAGRRKRVVSAPRKTHSAVSGFTVIQSYVQLRTRDDAIVRPKLWKSVTCSAVGDHPLWDNNKALASSAAVRASRVSECIRSPEVSDACVTSSRCCSVHRLAIVVVVSKGNERDNRRRTRGAREAKAVASRERFSCARLPPPVLVVVCVCGLAPPTEHLRGGAPGARFAVVAVPL
ncbi:hypothetical protein HPB51_004652 [Rhipicephalus microplus]|uniref:Uncharacterized protein n=1 Tax=Rhipicephalus microplus TaxID=6941 RepID=A0A9J6EES8_RHIMP|nr:hypothetical protein HPB51_004652 [Rhipicephalus microplus]